MQPALNVDIRQNYLQTLQRIEDAARAAGRDPAEVRLVVVTKGHPISSIRQVIEAGARSLGENYLEEALPKIAALADVPGLHWRMIGHVQSRKAAEVSRSFDAVDAVDSFRLASRLDRGAAEAGRRLPVLLECNVSGEESKFGWSAWDEASWAQLAEALRAVAALPNLQVQGLMTMPPFFDDPELSRPYFQRLHRLRETLAREIPEAGWDELSMGMSNDFEIAIQEGATQVRIGTAILGARQTPGQVLTTG